MSTDVSLRRSRSAVLAAGLTYGPADLIDFIIPLWAGSMLGADAAAVGALIALELIVSFLARPLAGVIADTRERRTMAAAAALLYALSCGLYAFATSMPMAYIAAVVGGLGGSLLWVALRTIVGERLGDDSGVFARLLGAQETGGWIAFVAGLTLLGYTDSFRTVFLLCAAACVAGAIVLALSPRHVATNDGETRRIPGGLSATARRLSPMLIVVVVTGFAESAIGLLLLLHLQRGLDLGIIGIAYVFLPGAIAMSVMPVPLHALVCRIGRRKSMAAGSVFSGIFAVSLAWAPGAMTIAGLWILSGVAFALLMPIEQAVLTECSPGREGHAMGVCDAAGLLGAAAGATAAGLLYDYATWQLACVVFGLVILCGAVIGPWAVRRLGVPDIPVMSLRP